MKTKREPENSSPNTSVEEAKTEGGGSSGGTALKRAYSLSDLNKPNVPRRILPAPPANGNKIRVNPRVQSRKFKLFKLHEPIFFDYFRTNTMLYTTRFSFLFYQVALPKCKLFVI